MPCLLVGINCVFRSQFGAQFTEDLRGSVDFEDDTEYWRFW
jgi:hypothetical protein